MHTRDYKKEKIEEEFDLELKEDTIRVQNNSTQLAKIYFKRETDRFVIYENHKFHSKVWSLIDTKDWTDEKNSLIRVEIVLESKIFLRLCDMKEGTITELPTDNLRVKAYKVQPYSISVLISAYNVVEYIEEMLNSFFSIEPIEHYKIDYYLAIDGDDNLLEHIYRLKLPPHVKVYYSKENQGSFKMVNSLAMKSSAEYILFFGADDLALPGIFENIEKLQENTILRFAGNTFSTQDSEHESKILRPGGVIMQRRDEFLNLRGYQPWRCQGDDEYNRRAEAHGKICVDVEQPFFQYRIHSNSLSNNTIYGLNSTYRNIYRKIIAENVATKVWTLPERLHEADNLVRIL